MSAAPQNPPGGKERKEETAQQGAGAGSGPGEEAMRQYYESIMQRAQAQFAAGPFGMPQFPGVSPYGGMPPYPGMPPYGGPTFPGMPPFGMPPFGMPPHGMPPHHHHHHFPGSPWPMWPWLMLWWPGVFSPFAMYLMMLQFAASRAHFWHRWFESMATSTYMSHPGYYWDPPSGPYPEPEDSAEFKYVRERLKELLEQVDDEHRKSATHIIEEMIHAYRMVRAMEARRRGWPWHHKPPGGYAW
jgi:hypothetical protein